AGETPPELAVRLSRAKAAAVAAQHPGAVVIGSDQVACHDDTPIGKPGTHARAVAQLRALSGRSVEFHSERGTTDGRQDSTEDVMTVCLFRTLDEVETEHYLQRKLPYDTAGSANAEGLGIALMESMQSDDPTAIIGLPIIALSRMLRQFGINPLLGEQGVRS